MLSCSAAPAAPAAAAPNTCMGVEEAHAGLRFFLLPVSKAIAVLAIQQPYGHAVSSSYTTTIAHYGL